MEKRKQQKAVALSYEKEKGAPMVVASGQGAIAEKILSTAREAGVEVVADPDLVELLAGVPLGMEIPAELYQAVAEILAFVYRANKSYKDKT
ncbi:flagellar biosynthesis protein FlhB [Syntrophotalea acetylenivorans]|uniref:Flagellar biosynthesis protein FlhB n=1 Tax=Syntrophotalea acetylenivorans TaxID=1842532 RepID=A0A1L3GN60_9BACT|nr:EscU/YscU/HrcU family type III secretion system export apparatus switch protein [Syntrophotalea acetylenivorans]APG27369.1 flagellar biosynthesis protein FlhB [Syntrophotalea acetylenivorans]